MSTSTIYDTGEQAFRRRSELNGHLAYEAFLGLARHPGRVFIVDRTVSRRVVKRGFLLTLAWLLSKKIGGWTEKRRVGIVFPPGLGAHIANLAVVFAGKVPVNLNFTLGAPAIRACLNKADLDCLLSTRAVRERMPDFPWSEAKSVVDIVEVLRILPKWKIVGMSVAVKCLPARWLFRWLGLPRTGGDNEAGLLFTSGSVGEPKGVVLTHRNILGNCAQITATGILTDEAIVLANLPVFHSFGFTVTLWYPVLFGCRIVTLPSPLETKKAAEAIRAESVTVLVGTPTFLKPYLKRVAPEDLKSIRFVVAGAEKTPEGFAEQWESTFGGRYLEGYGLTETSPVVSVNFPNRSLSGSVGPLLPGMAARILNPETFEVLPVEATGILALKGVNVFGGYLDDPEANAEVFRGEWFVTGDLARIDGDGFLHIEGRLSRFSKIGGEMVSHGAVEDALNRAFGLSDAERPLLAVCGRPDPAKGESLVVLSAIDLEINEVRDRLSAAGFANLWIPKKIRRIEAIPTLATGKLDLRSIQRMVKEGARIYSQSFDSMATRH